MSIPFWAWGVAALVGGYVLARWLVKKIDQAERDRAEKTSLENYVKGKLEADAAGERIGEEAKQVMDGPDAGDPLRW